MEHHYRNIPELGPLPQHVRLYYCPKPSHQQVIGERDIPHELAKDCGTQLLLMVLVIRSAEQRRKYSATAGVMIRADRVSVILRERQKGGTIKSWPDSQIEVHLNRVAVDHPVVGTQRKRQRTNKSRFFKSEKFKLRIVLIRQPMCLLVAHGDRGKRDVVFDHE